MNQPFRMALILLVGVLAMSSASILIRWAMDGGAPPLVIAAYRLVTASAALSIPAIRQHAWNSYTRLSTRQIAVLVVSGVLLSLHFAAWVSSLAHTSVMSSVVLVSTTPLWIGLAAPVVLGERTPRLTWLGILFAIGGGVTIGLADWSGGTGLSGWGNLLALLGAVFGAGYLMIGRGVRTLLPFVAYVWIVYGTAAAVLLTWSVLSKQALLGYSLETVACMVALGLIPQLIGHTAANYALRHLSASFVAITILGEPLGSTLLAIALLREMPGLGQVFGGLLILVGIILASLGEQQRTPQVTQHTRQGTSP